MPSIIVSLVLLILTAPAFATQVVITANSDDGDILSTSATYTTARAGGGTLVGRPSNTVMATGQYFDGVSAYGIIRPYLEFDLSSIPISATITAASLQMAVQSTATTGSNFNVIVREYNWSGNLAANAAADFTGCANASGANDFVWASTTGIVTDVYIPAGTSNVRLAYLVPGPGNTAKFCAMSSRVCNAAALGQNCGASGITPTGNEYILLYTSESATALKPQLVVDYTFGNSPTPTPTNTPTAPPTPATTPTRLPTFMGGTPPRCGEITH